MTQSGGAAKHFFSVTLYNFQKGGGWEGGSSPPPQPLPLRGPQQINKPPGSRNLKAFGVGVYGCISDVILYISSLDTDICTA